METKTKKVILMAILVSLTVLFVAVNNAYSITGTSDTNQITESYFMSFYDLAKGNTAWPVKKVEDNSVEIDGEFKVSEWSSSSTIYIAGEWQWSSIFRTQPNVFAKGALDFLAVWRVLYDTKYLYLSCEFRDDNHQEGSVKERWYDNDCAEFTFNNPTCTNLDTSTKLAVSRTLLIQKKFTTAKGLRGRLTSKRTDGTYDTTYVTDTLEGSSSVGGMVAAARSCGIEKYPGRWFLEARVPLCNVLAGDLALPVRGRTFKMNLKVYDDDTVSTVYTGGVPTVGVGMERYTKWYAYSGKTISEPLPTFVFAGAINETSPKPLPDVVNLYCGRTVKYYDSFLESAAEQEQVLNSKSILSFNVSPNPVTGTILSVNYNALQGPVVFSLFDASGRLLNTNTSYDVSGVYKLNHSVLGLNLPTGQYFMRMETADNRLTRPVLIIR